AEAGFRLKGARNADADRAGLTGSLLDLPDQINDDADAAFIIVARRLLAQADNLRSRACESDCLDFCAAPIDSDEHKGLLRVRCRLDSNHAPTRNSRSRSRENPARSGRLAAPSTLASPPI